MSCHDRCSSSLGGRAAGLAPGSSPRAPPASVSGGDRWCRGGRSVLCPAHVPCPAPLLRAQHRAAPLRPRSSGGAGEPPSSGCPPCWPLSGPGEAGVYQEVPVPVLSPRLARHVAGDALRWWGHRWSLGVRAASQGRAGCVPAPAAPQDAGTGCAAGSSPGVRSPWGGQELPREGSRGRGCRSCLRAGVGEPGLSPALAAGRGPSGEQQRGRP